jgi:lipoate-protein ligase B
MIKLSDDIALLEPGLVPYKEAWDLQKQIAVGIAGNVLPDTLILLEHPHTYTLGRSSHREHLLLSPEQCEAAGISVVEVDRGGDITYHGPGQLVIYPILSLGKPNASGRLPGGDYVGYLRKLEEVIIQTLSRFELYGYRIPDYTGVWVGESPYEAKIAAVGVRVNRQGISTHGAAVNVAPDLSYFSGIIPCGIADKAVTSLKSILGEKSPEMDELSSALKDSFETVFERKLTRSSPELLLLTRS